MAVWDNLGVVEEIARHIKSPEDFLSLGGVCQSSRSATADRKNFRCKSNQIPLLMLPPKPDDNNLRRFFSLSNRMSRRIHLPDTYGNRCCSSKGWLLVIDKSLNPFLLNPISSLRIDLPHIFTFKLWRDRHLRWRPDEYEYKLWLEQVCYITKFALSTSPTDSEDYTVVVVHHGPGKLAYYKPGFTSWVLIDCIRNDCVDVIYHQDKFYAIQSNCQIFCIDISRDNTVSYKNVFSLPFIRTVPSLHQEYLVEALGKILVVCRIGFTSKDAGSFSYGTTEFRVYEVDFVNNVWLEVNEIGPVAVFIGDNSSFSVQVLEESSPLQPNSIYFTDDCMDAYLDLRVTRPVARPGSGKDFGVYNLLTKRVEPLPVSYEEEFNPMAAHIWI